MAPAKIVDTAAYIKQLSTPPPPGAPVALPIPGSERPNRTPIYRHWRFRDGPLLRSFDENLHTVHDLFEDTLKKRGTQKKFLGWRPWNPQTRTWEDRYDWIGYNEAAEKRKNFGAGIVELHKRVGVKEDKYGVGLWAQNCPGWMLADLALMSQSLWSVSLYETLGPEASEYIINHSDLACVATTLSHVPTLLALAPKVPRLKIIITFESLDAGEPAGNSKLALLNQIAAQSGIQIFSMEQVEAIGLQSGRPMRPPQADDISTINYTSGTTGNPKGVVITHASSVAAVTGARSNAWVQGGDVHISYLPVAHIYGRMIDQVAMIEGASIGYFHGDMLGLVDDLKILRPHGLLSVPRLFNRFNSTIKSATVEADGFKGALSRRVIDTKKANMKLPPGQAHNKHIIYDRIWTPKVLKAVGLDRAKFMVSGSAQLDPDVHTFLRAAFGIDFMQGYGLTETYAVGTNQVKGDYSTGTIGGPMGNCEICLESVPDMEYSVTDKPNPRGELLMRGPIVFKEYHKDPAETAKALESDGWFHTGDIVEIDKLGRIWIVDRKKNVLKLAQGEYVSPERIENVYMGSCNLIATAFVHGDGKESTLVGIFGVDPEKFAPWAGKVLGTSIAATDIDAIKVACANPKIVKAMLKKLDDIGKAHKFNSFERVKDLVLAVDPFSIANETLTPTLKLKRAQAAKAWRSEIDRMYASINAAAPKAKL